MKFELFPFQKVAEANLRRNTMEALSDYQKTHTPQVLSFTSPTGSGKTIIVSSLIENIFCGDEEYGDQENAIFVWISDSPELNQQSKDKIDRQADKIKLRQCVTIEDDSFDQEILDDGHIYFLNTQKLGKASNLTKNSDMRQYTIWQTLQNTIEQKSDRLYLIIDEAHRGMQGKDASKATSIMQKFIKGSNEISPFPVVIGMSATSQRFDELVKGTISTIRKVIVTTDEVRSSGLLKDRIIVTYPESGVITKDMTIIQAAAVAWKDKCEHWHQYCKEQHYAYVHPIFVIQVQNSNKRNVSDTNLDDCLKRVESVIGFKFKDGEVVHTFGQTTSDLKVNGLKVKYEEPSGINDDKQVKVVFFKENLSTGWDCPRAETMVSFRRAVDSTYIAQLLGRMIRTPMQMHIQVDETLNDVRLFLPNFDALTVKNVVKELQGSEGSDIPTEIVEEDTGDEKYDVLTVHVPRPVNSSNVKSVSSSQNADKIKRINSNSADFEFIPEPEIIKKKDKGTSTKFNDLKNKNEEKELAPDNNINREEIVKAINDMGLLTYKVRDIQINNYLKSLYKLAHLLTQSGAASDAVEIVNNDIIKKIDDYINRLKNSNEYEGLAKKVKSFKLSNQVFDVFGKSVKESESLDLFITIDADIEKQFKLADIKLGREGIGNAYLRKYYVEDEKNLLDYKVNVILFASDDTCHTDLLNYAKEKFHELDDKYRRYTVQWDEKSRKKYDDIVANGDRISKHNFRLSETITLRHEINGKNYYDHLLVNDKGYAQIKLNSWEQDVIREEEQKKDFVCWLRNIPSKPWSLTIPYKKNGNWKSAYPDFLIVRKDDRSKFKYIVDVLEPHADVFNDNLGKAKGFADYVERNTGIGNVELIRKEKAKLKRLNLSRSGIREKVLHAVTNEELDHIFDEYGQVDR